MTLDNTYVYGYHAWVGANVTVNILPGSQVGDILPNAYSVFPLPPPPLSALPLLSFSILVCQRERAQITMKYPLCFSMFASLMWR